MVSYDELFLKVPFITRFYSHNNFATKGYTTKSINVDDKLRDSIKATHIIL
jgi:hypothetical protein